MKNMGPVLNKSLLYPILFVVEGMLKRGQEVFKSQNIRLKALKHHSVAYIKYSYH